MRTVTIKFAKASTISVILPAIALSVRMLAFTLYRACIHISSGLMDLFPLTQMMLLSILAIRVI